MTFKGTPNMAVIDKHTHERIGRFDERGYMEVPEAFAYRMKNKFEEVTLRYCECGEPFENQGDYMTHCKTCAIHKMAKGEETENKAVEAPKRGRKKNDGK
jgi:uncharacterized C2H2 Zn-finger protein